MTAVLQARDVLRSSKLMSPPDDHRYPSSHAHPHHPLTHPLSSSFPSSTDWESKFRESEAKRHELEALLEDTRLELDEFQSSSRELEEELEKDLERSEKAKLDLETKVAKIENEKDEWKVPVLTLPSHSDIPHHVRMLPTVQIHVPTNDLQYHHGVTTARTRHSQTGPPEG